MESNKLRISPNLLSKVPMFEQIPNLNMDVYNSLSSTNLSDKFVSYQTLKTYILSRLNKTKRYTEFEFISSEIQVMFQNVVAFQQRLFYESKLDDFFELNKQKILIQSARAVINEFKDVYPKTFKQFESIVSQGFDYCQKRIEEEFKTTLNFYSRKRRNISIFTETHKSLNTYFITLFKGYIQTKLGEDLKEVLALAFQGEIHIFVAELIFKLMYKTYWQDHAAFKSSIHKDLFIKFRRNLNGFKAEWLFTGEKLRGKYNVETLFNIILLTNYHSNNSTRREIYLSLINKFYSAFIIDYDHEYSELISHLNIIRSKKLVHDEGTNRILKLYVNKWEDSMKYAGNITAITDLFIAFHLLAKNHLQKSYNSHIRYLLKCILRNLKNGDLKFTNFQILCCMECLSTDAATLELSSARSLDMTLSKVQRSPVLNNNLNDVLELFNVQDITLTLNSQEEGEEDNLEIVCEYFNNEEKINNPKTKPPQKIELPREFVFEQISDAKICSKSIIICMSSFTLEDNIKIKEWKAICKALPYTECVLLNWNPQLADDTLDSTLRILKKFIRQEKHNNHTFSLVWNKILSDQDVLDYQTLKLFKACCDIAMEEARITGVHLAHALANVDVFQGRVVNFIGSGFGTEVIINCISELEKIGKCDIVYDVLLIGGVSDINELRRKSLNSVCYRIINCYSESDYNLKYLVQMINSNINPIGTCPIQPLDIITKNFDISNKDYTEYKDSLYDIIVRSDFNEDLKYLLFN